MKDRGQKLSMEDRILWSRVARTVAPLPGKEQADLLQDEPEAMAQGEPPPVQMTEASVPATARPAAGTRETGRLRPLDRPTKVKLAKERLSIEARVDLHGLTQAEAHALLLSFLQRALAQGLRHVLVITGKGSSMGSEGILQRAVPAWFGTPPFRPLVSSYDHAARHHGGSGALYVRLRRPPGGQGG